MRGHMPNGTIQTTSEVGPDQLSTLIKTLQQRGWLLVCLLTQLRQQVPAPVGAIRST